MEAVKSEGWDLFNQIIAVFNLFIVSLINYIMYSLTALEQGEPIPTVCIDDELGKSQGKKKNTHHHHQPSPLLDIEVGAVIALCWCAMLTVLWIFSAIFFYLLWKRVTKVVASHGHNELPLQNPHAKMASVYNYGSPVVEPGEELARRGYAKHNPRPITPEIISEERHPKRANSIVHRGEIYTRDNTNDEPYFADDFVGSKPNRKQQASKAVASEVPHFFSTQLSQKGSQGQQSGSHPSTAGPSTSRGQSQGITNSNFQY